MTKKFFAYFNINELHILKERTKRLTPQSGRSSTAADTKSFPYFEVNILRTSMSSGISAHLGDANITLQIASFKSIGQFLEK